MSAHGPRQTVSVPDFEAAYVALRSTLKAGILAHASVKALDAMDPAEHIAAIENELLVAFEKWKPRVRDADDFCSVRFEWAGADVAPYVPQDVWSKGYAGDPFQGVVGTPRAILFREAPGFEPRPLGLLKDAIDEDLEEMPDEVFDGLKEMFVARSLAWAARALSSAMHRPEFKALRPVSPFHFLASPGHDEGTLVLGVWQR